VAVVAFADEDVADEASGVNVVDAAAGLAAGRGQAEKNFEGRLLQLSKALAPFVTMPGF